MSGTSRREGLWRDDRGAILVVGLCFVFVWIGMIWFLFGVGNVIAYRENMQNAADAAAFAGAVYDARGMNLIAMINNLMGVALATLIAMKFAQIANLVQQGQSCHDAEGDAEDTCDAIITLLGPCEIAIGVAVAECVEDCENVVDYQSKVHNFDQGVHVALSAMHTVETVIGTGWPWVAAGKSNVGGDDFGYHGFGVVSTLSASYSQNPRQIDPDGPKAPSDAKCPSDGGLTSAGLCPIGPRCGLPITSDHYSTDCRVAMDDITSIGGVVPPIITSVTGYASEAWYDFGAEWFCDDGSGSGRFGELPDTIFTTGGTAAISFAAFWECELVESIVDVVKDVISGTSPTNGNLSLIPMSNKDVPDTCPAYSPMAIYAPAKMGLDYYGVWGAATGVWTAGHHDFAAAKVKVAGVRGHLGGNAIDDPPGDADKAVARAEFYYEPYGSSGSVDSGDDIKAETTIQPPHDAEKNVMWNMRWRARLRRFHFMPGYGLGLVPGNVGLSDEAVYIKNLMEDSDVLKVLALHLSGGVGVDPTVSSQKNDPPLGMYH